MVELTIGRSMRLAAEAHPHATAITFEGRDTTHAELEAWSNRIAHGLLSVGLRRGDRVGLMLGNSPLYVALVIGAAKAGIAFVPLNYRFTDADLAYHLGDAQASAIIFEAAYRAPVCAARQNLPGVHAIVVGEADGDEVPLDAIVGGQPSTAPGAVVSENDVLALQYTSGTTGRPKGAIITHRNRSLAYLHWPTIFDIRANDVLLHVGPFHHSAPLGMVLCQLSLGGRVVILPGFKPEAALTAIERDGVTWAFMVPTMYEQIHHWLATRGLNARLPSLKRLLSGASPLPTAVKERILQAFPNAGLFEFYGATEAGMITALRPEEQLLKTRCVGRPVLGAEIKVVDQDGHRVAPGVVGEIVLRTQSLFEGYFNAPAQTAAAFQDGWCRLGDLGHLDGDGYLHIVDRLKDVIKSGGVNIYPSEIEEVLLGHPDVREAAVIGIPSERWGESAHAIVVTRSGQTADAHELADYCRRHLADYKVPKSIETRPLLPRNPAGKILKRTLREAFWRGSEAMV